jgi:hypothetical protein
MNHEQSMPRRKLEEIGERVMDGPVRNHPSRRYPSFLGETTFLAEGRRVCWRRLLAADET